ncbi:MAG: DUF481 domain-containing protein [Calditrichaeota bacterium]|nr:DUF481 domain-containing protein [Calditrichota bacterium]
MFLMNRQYGYLKIALWTVMGILWSSTLAGQVNIEGLRNENRDPGWYNRLGTLLTIQDGNTRFVKIDGSWRTDLLREHYHGFVIAKYAQGRQNGKDFQKKAFLHQRNTFRQGQRIMPEIFVQVAFDDFVDLRRRLLGGGGLRFRLNGFEKNGAVTPAAWQVYIGSGLMWENEQINSTGEDTGLLRSTNYLSWTFKLDERLSFSGIGYWQLAVEDFADQRVLFEGGMNVSIWKGVAFNVNLNYRFDNQPPAGIKKYDLELQNGLTLRW